ncbi:response regulator [Sporosalibacterium faouarense]|uniref:response regulator n=1 Tax=Sporosalibacterium faouarense TaxID=516123 RepID=UPI00192C6529|nr:response regulator [Sporosalibacterium faouarense]
MRKILVVEDEKNIILPLKMFLQKSGYDVRIARNGVDAINEAQEFIPDLILLDILLPKMNGYLVCQSLKEEQKTKHIPVIFMSAKTQQEDIKKALSVGGEEYIVKPFTNEELKKILNKYLKEDE